MSTTIDVTPLAAVEPAAALPLAALRSGAWRPREAQRICLIVCGANVDPATLA